MQVNQVNTASQPLILSPPGLIMVTGAPGTGKSVLSKVLSTIVCATHIDKDVINEALRPREMDARTFRSSEYYAKNVRRQSYEVMYALASANLEYGVSVILDAPHIEESRDPKWRSFIEQMASSHGANLHVFQTILQLDKLHGRILERNATRDHEFLTCDAAFASRVSKCPPDEEISWPNQKVHIVDTNVNLTEKEINGMMEYLLRDKER